MRARLIAAFVAAAIAAPAAAQAPAQGTPPTPPTPAPPPRPIEHTPSPPLPAQQIGQLVVDIPTRKGVTQRFLYLSADKPRAAAVLFTGGNGALRINAEGGLGMGHNNFLVRTSEVFARHGLAVALLDAPSDRLSPPFLEGVRDGADHQADIAAVIAWLRVKAPVPVWLVGMSRGTQSVAHFAAEVPRASGGPDGIVLASSIMYDPRGVALPWMPLERIAVPALLVHHKNDGCWVSPYEGVPAMMERVSASPRRALITAEGGRNRGDPCGPFAYHGFDGLEFQTVSAIVQWMLQP